MNRWIRHPLGMTRSFWRMLRLTWQALSRQPLGRPYTVLVFPYWDARGAGAEVDKYGIEILPCIFDWWSWRNTMIEDRWMILVQRDRRTYRVDADLLDTPALKVSYTEVQFGEVLPVAKEPG